MSPPPGGSPRGVPGSQFEQRSEWTAAALASALEVPVPVLRRRAVLWVNHGVLAEHKDADSGEPGCGPASFPVLAPRLLHARTRARGLPFP